MDVGLAEGYSGGSNGFKVIIADVAIDV